MNQLLPLIFVKFFMKLFIVSLELLICVTKLRTALRIPSKPSTSSSPLRFFPFTIKVGNLITLLFPTKFSSSVIYFGSLEQFRSISSTLPFIRIHFMVKYSPERRSASVVYRTTLSRFGTCVEVEGFPCRTSWFFGNGTWNSLNLAENFSRNSSTNFLMNRLCSLGIEKQDTSSSNYNNCSFVAWKAFAEW